jgi:hypothetical protein
MTDKQSGERKRNYERISWVYALLSIDFLAMVSAWNFGYPTLAAILAMPLLLAVSLFYAFGFAFIIEKLSDICAYPEEIPAKKIDVTHLSIAKIYLEMLREGETEPEYRIKLLLEEARLGNFTLKELGIDEFGLASLASDCYRMVALKYLRRMRKVPVGSEDPMIFPEYFKAFSEAITKGNISLRSLKTNEEEVKSFMLRAKKTKK